MLNKLNISALKGGPAILYFGPTAVYFKNGIDLDPSAEWEDIVLDGYDVVDKRKKKQPIMIKGTPSGVYNAAHLAALCALATMPLGSFITPRFANITPVFGTSTLTIPLHSLTSGQSGYVAVSGTGVIPTGLVAATLYYINVTDANNITLHLTQADALADANAVAFTDDGTGPVNFVINNVLRLQSINDGKIIDFGNYAMEAIPDVMLTADGKTIFGEVSIGCFLRHGYKPSDANSYFTAGTNAFDPTTFPNLAQILTQPYEANWGGQIYNVTAASVANPTVITTDKAHGLVTGDYVNLVVSDSTPVIGGKEQVTVISPTTFSVAVHVTNAGTTGTVQLAVTPPWDNINTKEGYKLKFTTKVEDVPVDGLGVPTKQLTGATAEVSFLPTDADSADLLNALNVQGASGALGSSLAAGAYNFNILGTNFYAVLFAANFTKAPLKFNMKDRRAGEVTLQATRQIVSGISQPLMFLGTASPY